MTLRHTALLLLAGFATAHMALAHQGVTNPAVMARMEAMSDIGAHTKTLGEMAKGERGFDAATARQAARGIADAARRTPALFADPQSDPKSEALPGIWEDFDDFTAKSDTLVTAAEDASRSISDPDNLKVALAQIGDACKACHALYRK